MKPILLLLLLSLWYSLKLFRNHDYWFLKSNPISVRNDSEWTIVASNVCTWKNIMLKKILLYLCLKLCLRMPSLLAMWNTGRLEECIIRSKVISNDWSEDNCGADYKHWSATGEFNIKGIYGQGIATEIAENAAYS